MYSVHCNRYSSMLMFVITLMASCLCFAAQNTNVLIINSYHQSLPWTNTYNQSMIMAASNNSKMGDHTWQLYFENMDTSRLTPFNEALFVHNLQEKYDGIQFAGVLADSTPAAEFVYKYRSTFDWPVQILYENNLQLDDPNVLNFGNTQIAFVEKTLQLLMAQNPSLETLYIVESGVPLQEAVIPIVEHFMQDHKKVKLVIETDFILEELIERSAEYDVNSAVLFNLVFTDKTGRDLVPKQVLSRLVSKANAPVYVLYSPLIGSGAMGGHVSDVALTANSSLQAIDDYLENGKFKKNYRSSHTVIDESVAKRFGLPVRVNGLSLTVINKSIPWAQIHNEQILWLTAVVSIMLMLSFFWAARIRYVNSKLSHSNLKLAEFKRKLSDKNKELKRQSMLDPLTNLLNRRALLPKIEEAIDEFKRYDLHSTLMLIDLDDFKVINDRYGHNIGDTILKSFSYMLRSESRRTDFVGRWGGEEFIILAKGIDAKEAGLFLEKVRSRMSLTQLVNNQTITFSAGICELSKEHTAESIVAQADEAMYKAKNQSKNCTVVYAAKK